MYMFSIFSVDDGEVNFDACSFCDVTPHLPHTGGCQRHVYCYYCVAVALQKDENVTCPTCNVEIGDIQPLAKKAAASS